MRFLARSALLATFLLGVLGAAPLAAAADTQLTGSGRFEGHSRHTASGGASLLKTESGYLLVLESDFSFDGAPDPKLGFGKQGFAKDTLFSKLRSNGGSQVYAIPEGIDPTRYDEVWIWCEKFGVPLGVASLR